MPAFFMLTQTQGDPFQSFRLPDLRRLITAYLMPRIFWRAPVVWGMMEKEEVEGMKWIDMVLLAVFISSSFEKNLSSYRIVTSHITINTGTKYVSNPDLHC